MAEKLAPKIVCAIQAKKLYEKPEWRKFAANCQRLAAGRCRLCQPVEEPSLVTRLANLIPARRRPVNAGD